MKKFLFIFILIPFLPMTSVHASTPVVRVVDVPHTNFDGTFRDNLLAEELLPTGKLGKLIYTPRQTVTWVVDASLLDEIIDMSDGYTFNGEDGGVGVTNASAWLNQLRAVTQGDPIVALPYGNPDSSLLKKLESKELAYYSQNAQLKLEEFFGRPVISQNGWGSGKSRLSDAFQAFYSDNRDLVAGLDLINGDEEISSLRLKLGRVLNPLLDSDERTYFSNLSNKAVREMSSKLQVVSGRYQLTSQTVKVPVTLINEFDSATVINVSLIPMNARVQVQNISNVEIPPHSRIQLSVPFTVIAPGSTVVVAQLMTPQGELIGEQARLNLSLTVIDSRVAWFTTAAGIALFAGAIAQSVRRFRRSRREE